MHLPSMPPPMNVIVFDPQSVRPMEQAFDQAWAEIARDFGDIASEIDNARLRLADAMFSVAIEGTVEVAALKEGALHAMAMNYCSRTHPTPEAAPIRIPLRSTPQPTLCRASSAW
jgi:hypothetical protein